MEEQTLSGSGSSRRRKPDDQHLQLQDAPVARRQKTEQHADQGKKKSKAEIVDDEEEPEPATPAPSAPAADPAAATVRGDGLKSTAATQPPPPPSARRDDPERAAAAVLDSFFTNQLDEKQPSLWPLFPIQYDVSPSVHSAAPDDGIGEPEKPAVTGSPMIGGGYPEPLLSAGGNPSDDNARPPRVDGDGEYNFWTDSYTFPSFFSSEDI